MPAPELIDPKDDAVRAASVEPLVMRAFARCVHAREATKAGLN